MQRGFHLSTSTFHIYRYQWNSVDPWQLEGGNDIGNKYTRSILDVDWAGKLISEGFKAVGQKTELIFRGNPYQKYLYI